VSLLSAGGGAIVNTTGGAGVDPAASSSRLNVVSGDGQRLGKKNSFNASRHNMLLCCVLW
jgi:hypothetical protein